MNAKLVRPAKSEVRKYVNITNKLVKTGASRIAIEERKKIVNTQKRIVNTILHPGGFSSKVIIISSLERNEIRNELKMDKVILGIDRSKPTNSLKKAISLVYLNMTETAKIAAESIIGSKKKCCSNPEIFIFVEIFNLKSENSNNT